MEIKEIPIVASTDISKFNNSVYVCVYKHFGMGLMKINSEHYVELINNQITEFTKLSLVNIFTSYFFWGPTMCWAHYEQTSLQAKAVLEELIG